MRHRRSAVCGFYLALLVAAFTPGYGQSYLDPYVSGVKGFFGDLEIAISAKPYTDGNIDLGSGTLRFGDTFVTGIAIGGSSASVILDLDMGYATLASATVTTVTQTESPTTYTVTVSWAGEPSPDTARLWVDMYAEEFAIITNTSASGVVQWQRIGK